MTVMSDHEQSEIEEIDHVSGVETLAVDEHGDWRFLVLPNEIYQHFNAKFVGSLVS